ncbi:2,4'-dihydroxyacetophenone dioxygenase family protein [Sphingobium sp. CR2-8]|uniref:2,4'-dihydroxyacetophenone dioxygenase family protein n=1 Tax=Sphingobium sp. CR2-8 TaxID=1306534 RepID=UPI002DBDD323|nr:2,4'-dihydroxyacetophenone dioxygenase family protein [Sphingobium sp. CR2-8]MEC3909386.1 2,4'-dihydroxyacetophenone dioxygenase family protein [Sphingobium sp. CR2-8]
MTATAAAANVPAFSLPQDRLLTLNINETTVLQDAAGPGVSFQPLYVDPELGVWTVIGIFAPGASVPMHIHTGPVHGFTMKGSWYYAEYPDQVQVPGSYLYEPASSLHTVVSPEGNTEDTHVLFIVNGANVNFGPDGQFHSILDAMTIQKMIEQWSQANGGAAVDYIAGGSARQISKA